MIRVVLHLILLAAVATGFAWLADRPGGLMLTVGAYRIETGLAAAAAGLIAVVLIVDLVIRIVGFVLRIPSALGSFGRNRNRAKGLEAVTRGMVAVGSGDAKLARRAADEARRRLGSDPLALLLQAQSAQMAGDRAAAEGAFRAMLDTPDTRLLGLRGLFVEAGRRGDRASALRHAEEAVRLAPSAGWASEAVLERLCAENRWKDALAALDRTASGHDKDVLRRRRAVLLTADAAATEGAVPDTALAQAREALRLAPDLVPAAVLAGRLLVARGDLRKASKLLEAAWREAPHPDLADLYVHLRHGDAARDRLARAERLLLLRPDDQEGRFAVAVAALDARDFDRVRSAVQPLLVERPTVRLCLLMAKMEEIEHGDTGHVREWLARASRASRDHAWVADGLASESWAPVSPVTGRLDAFRWMRPVEVLAGPSTHDPSPGAAAGVPATPDPAPLPVSSAGEIAASTPEPAADAASGRGSNPGSDATSATPLKSASVAPAAPAVEPVPSRRIVPPSEVVFPLPAAPDDPGPDGAGELLPREGRLPV